MRIFNVWIPYFICIAYEYQIILLQMSKSISHTFFLGKFSSPPMEFLRNTWASIGFSVKNWITRGHNKMLNLWEKLRISLLILLKIQWFFNSGKSFIRFTDNELINRMI